MKILTLIWDKILIILATGCVTVVLTVISPIRESIVHHFQTGKEIEVIDKRIEEIQKTLAQPPVVKPDTAMYNILAKMEKQLYIIGQQNKVASAKLDVLKKSNEDIKDKFDLIDKVSAVQEYNYNPKITVQRK
jgi:hypothetical protein